MSSQILPDYPDLFSLDLDKISTIEAKCRKVGHLAVDEGLLDRITKDLELLKIYGLKKTDVYLNHRNMYLKFNKTDQFDAFTCDKDGHGPHANNLFANLPKGFGKGWCLQQKTTNEIELNGQHLRISCFVWGGAEQCAIEKSFTDEYNGYSRGDRDWFVTNLDLNLNIWIPDLLPAQISMFGFFQSPSSPYRLDPEKYIKILGLDQLPIIPIKSHKEVFWGCPSGPMTLDRNDNIIDEQDTEIYHAICCWSEHDKNQKELLIHFKNNQWIKDNKHQRIKIFGMDLDIGDIFNENDYLIFVESTITVLDERDDSDSISRKIQEQGQCVIQ